MKKTLLAIFGYGRGCNLSQCDLNMFAKSVVTLVYFNPKPSFPYTFNGDKNMTEGNF